MAGCGDIGGCGGFVVGKMLGMWFGFLRVGLVMFNVNFMT